MLLAGATAAAATRSEAALQERARREPTTVAASAPLYIDAGGGIRGDGISIDRIAHAGKNPDEYCVFNARTEPSCAARAVPRAWTTDAASACKAFRRAYCVARSR